MNIARLGSKRHEMHTGQDVAEDYRPSSTRADSMLNPSSEAISALRSHDIGAIIPSGNIWGALWRARDATLGPL